MQKIPGLKKGDRILFIFLENVILIENRTQDALHPHTIAIQYKYLFIITTDLNIAH